MYDSAIRKNISVFYDEFSVFLENLRFVAASLPVYIMNSNYVDQHSWGEVHRHRGSPRNRGGGHHTRNRNTSGRFGRRGGQGKPSEDHHRAPVAGLPDSGKEDRE